MKNKDCAFLPSIAGSRFRGGIHPPDSKELTRDKPISRIKNPSRFTVSLVQHLGAPGGGFILFGGAHVDQGNPDNLRAMMEAAKEYDKYK